MKRAIFLFLVLHALVCWGQAAEEVWVFNVGQGNCNLFIPKGGGRPVLYDAGSTQRPVDYEDQAIDKIITVRDITAQVQRVLPRNRHINVVISHGHTDHYNLIFDVLKGLGGNIKTHFFMGGSRSDYAETFRRELNKIPHARRLTELYAEDVLAGQKMRGPYISDAYTGQFLAHLFNDTGRRNPDKNAFSLILKIAYRYPEVPLEIEHFVDYLDQPYPKEVLYFLDRPLDALVVFTGDATEVATDSAQEQEMPFSTGLIVANHHGAATEGSSSPQWIAHISPQVAVFSAAQTSHYKHPQGTIVARYLKLGNLQGESLHEFTYAADGPLGLARNIFAPYHEGDPYFRAVTRQAIFNTMNEGHLCIRMDDLQARDGGPGALPFFLSINPDKAFFSMFPLKGLQEINLEGIAITNPELLVFLPRFHVAYALQTLGLQNNHLALGKESIRGEAYKDGEQVLQAFADLLRQMQDINKITLWENRIEVEYIQEVIPEEALYNKLELHAPQ